MVETAVLEAGQAGFEVALDHVDAVADGGEHAGIVDLDAPAAHAARLDQQLEQRAVAAAEVEHALAGLHPAGDDVEIGAAEGDGVIGHGVSAPR